MFGKTNSVVQSSSGGSGADIIYAVNNTGGEIAAGDKVWLNQHILESDTTVRIAWKDRYTPYPTVFNLKSRMFANKTTTLRRLAYNAETNSWHSSDVCSMIGSYLSSFYFKDGLVWAYKYDGYSYIIKNSGEQKEIAGCVLSADKVIDRKTSRLTTYNPVTGVIESSVGAVLPSFDTSATFAHLDGDLLFYQKNTSGNYIYDVSDYANPVLLNTFKFSTEYARAFHMTGVGVGNYIFTKYMAASEWDENQFYLYKIVSGYAVELASDVPESLRALIGKICRFSYNNDTNIFIIGTGTNLYFYKFENGAFHEFYVKFGALPNKGVLLARLTDDMSTIGITYNDGGYYTTHVYRLQVADDKWYAEDFATAHPLSMVGYVTGKQNEDGLYEIKTLLPEVCRYSLTVVPEPDVIEFKGETL